jgi:hypothetical protein
MIPLDRGQQCSCPFQQLRVPACVSRQRGRRQAQIRVASERPDEPAQRSVIGIACRLDDPGDASLRRIGQQADDAGSSQLVRTEEISFVIPEDCYLGQTLHDSLAGGALVGRASANDSRRTFQLPILALSLTGNTTTTRPDRRPQGLGSSSYCDILGFSGCHVYNRVLVRPHNGARS